VNKYINCINYIISQNNKDSLHLINIYNRLRKWGCSEDICYAGLFYSLEDRETVKKLIGKKAESLYFSSSKESKILSLAIKLNKPFINVIDNYFDQYSILESYYYFRDIVPWRFIGSGADNTRWRKFKYDLNFKNKIELKFKKETEAILKNSNYFDILKPERVYASASPYGTVNLPHKDYEGTDGLTIMYYLNESWNLDFGGETVFYNEQNDEIQKSVIPKPGRVLFFDGNITHVARDTVRNFNDLRMVLTFKYEINI
jgi:hypothetical protein